MQWRGRGGEDFEQEKAYPELRLLTTGGIVGLKAENSLTEEMNRDTAWPCPYK